MGLVVGEWVFPTGGTPDVATVAAGLRAGTGLAVTVEGAGASATLSIPRVGERLFDWSIEHGRLVVHAFGPPHPYVWENLDAVLSAGGGRVGDTATTWRPDPANAALRRPWASLTRRQRTLLQIPTIGAFRPLDHLLA